MNSWKDLQDDANGDDPGRVARIDQLHASMTTRYNRWWWRLVRWCRR